MHNDGQGDGILGVLNQDVLASMVQTGGGGIPSMPASNEGLQTEFFSATHRFFRMWLEDKVGPQSGTKPCAIVLSRSISQDIERLGAKRLWYFDSTADALIGGKVLIANSDLSIVAEVPIDECATSNAVAEALTKTRLDQSVHCVLLGHRGEMRLCRDGLNGATTLLKVLQPSAVKLGPAELDKHLWSFHRKFTQTSAGILRPWKGKAVDRITIDEAELRISLTLGFYLGTIIGEDNVTVEDLKPHGRLDIKITAHAMAQDLGPCAMECKVLRSREVNGNGSRSVSANKMIQHASDGVQQAIEYRQDLGGKLAYLCCFDARSVDAEQPEIQKLAHTNDVTLRRYYMYASPEDHRKAVAAAKKTGVQLAGEAA